MSTLNLSLFDKSVAFTLILMGLITALIVWRGSQVGVQIVSITPADGATDVSTRAEIEITFDKIMSGAVDDIPFAFEPPIGGSIRWDGSRLIFSPDTAFDQNTTYRVSLTDQFFSQSGRLLLDQPSWQFQTGPICLLYIAPVANSGNQLFTMNPFNPDEAPLQLTQEPQGVFDYALSFDGAMIAFSALHEDGRSDLKIVPADASRSPTMLLECGEAECTGVAWMPDGQRLIYERRNIPTPFAAPGPSRLWWLNLDSGETTVVFDDTQNLGYGARWSSGGEWFSYVAPASEVVQLYNIHDGRNVVIPSRLGEIAEWNPQGDMLLVPEIQRSETGGFAVHLVRSKPDSGQLQDISGEGMAVEDTSPKWSPDGAWIVLTRKTSGTTMGKQLWLMRPDGSESRQLTDESQVHHSFPVWSPDGRYLAYQRYSLEEVDARPSLWLLDVESGDARELMTPGFRPTWLP
ncbi:MAG: Ig-like domain-containing protein [Anaerolineales bacterium]|nr:Ig-like domain-containing protein [Anaerolineales bacterium]